MKFFKAVFSVGILTLVSRIVGYARDVVVAYSLGASLLNDIFIIALRLPNMFRSIFGEGALSSAFIPIFSRLLNKKGKDEALMFATKVHSLLILVLTIFCVIAIIFMPYIMKWMAPGYAEDEAAFNLAINLGRITFPYILFISLMAFYGGIGNSIGNYAAFASAPILMNIVLLIAACIGDTPLSKTYSLSYGLVIAGILEMIWVMYFVYRSFALPKIEFPSFDKNTKSFFKRIIPGIFGSGITQLNLMVSTMIATFFAGGVSYLYYADRIYQLPLAIIGTALATILLPELAKYFAINKLKRAFAVQNHALELASFFTIPITFYLIILSAPIIKLLFEYGQFNSDDTIKTAAALSVFALGLPVYVINKTLTSIYFAAEDTKTPVKISAIVLVVNIVCSIAFLPVFQHVAVAVGSVVASWLNGLILSWLLIKQRKFIIYKRTRIKLTKILIAGMSMFLVLYYVKPLLIFSNIMVELVTTFLIGGVVYIVLLLLMGAYKCKTIFNYFYGTRIN